MTRSVVIMAKAPVAGQAKTRLAAGIGDAAASAFAEAFIADVTETVAGLSTRRVLAWAGDVDHEAFGPARRLGFALQQQVSGDLGQRMDAVLRAEAGRSESVIVIGSDSPTLTKMHFDEAWDALENHDVVVGPSFDGGYYMLGINSPWFLKSATDGVHPLLADIAWSTDKVLDQTLRRCRNIGALCDLIRFCYDVDTLQDLDLLKTHLLEHLRPSGLDVARNTAILLAKTPTD